MSSPVIFTIEIFPKITEILRLVFHAKKSPFI